MPYLCPRAHTVRGPADMLPTTNRCRECDREDQLKYRQRQKLSMHLLKQMERAGLSEFSLRESDGFAIALKWLAESSPRELAKLENEHPALIAKVRNQLARLDEGAELVPR